VDKVLFEGKQHHLLQSDSLASVDIENRAGLSQQLFLALTSINFSQTSSKWG